MTQRVDVGQGLKTLLNDELCALAAYRRAIERIGDQSTLGTLGRLGSNHEEVISHLRIALIDREFEPVDDPVITGSWAAATRRIGTAYGEDAILTELRTIEEQCLADCDEVLESDLLGDTTRRLVQDVVIPRLEACLADLDALFEVGRVEPMRV